MKTLESKIEYKWQDNWAFQNTEDGSSHNDIVIDSEGLVYVSFSVEPYLRVFNCSGVLLRTCNLSGPHMHSLFISKDSDGEFLWNIDVINNTLTKSTLEGEIIQSIGKDSFKVKENERFNITTGSYDPVTGNVWVSDGYGWAREGNFGGNRIFCFNSELELLTSFDGSESECGVFREPHSVFIDTRKGVSELYISDRRKHRLVVYDNEGRYLRTISGFNTPSALSVFGDKMVVAELEGRIIILDHEDNQIATLCGGSEYSQIDGWPNRCIDNETVSPLKHIDSGKFNSPHGIASDPEGNIYVHEWLHGVRLTKLVRG